MGTILLLIATAATGQTAATNHGEAKLTYHGRLKDALRMPVAVSPDEKKILYFVRVMEEAEGKARAKHAYQLADSDGSDQRLLFQTPVEWDDFLNAVTTQHAFSADGKRIVVATTDNGKSIRDQKNPGRAVPAIINEQGEAELVPCALGSCAGFGFLGNSLLVLDTPGLVSGQGYQLTWHKLSAAKVIHADEKAAAFCLRISPSGGQAAFFVSAHVGSAIVRIRVVNLNTGEIEDSPEFRSHSATFDGRPQLFWDESSEGVYCHVSTHARSKWPYELTHYNFRTRSGKVVAPRRNIGASAMLGGGKIAMWHPDAGGCSVLYRSQSKLYRLPEHNYILGGRGERVVVADLERNAVYSATLHLTDRHTP